MSVRVTIVPPPKPLDLAASNFAGAKHDVEHTGQWLMSSSNNIIIEPRHVISNNVAF